MHKLSIYLSPSQYEKLQILFGMEDEEKIEEFINEAVYDGIAKAWIAHKAEALSDALESGEIGDETVRLSLDGHDYEIWSDGEQAVVSDEDKPATVQQIGGHMHYVLENGNRVECSEGSQKTFESVLKEAGFTIKDFTKEEPDECIIVGECHE